MARGLYSLGFTDEEVWAQLPPLSLHQKLDEHILLPYELWPPTWREPEGDLIMELSEFDFQVRRYAAAFGIESWERIAYDPRQFAFVLWGQRADGWWVHCAFMDENHWWMHVADDPPETEIRGCFSVLTRSAKSYDSNSYPSPQLPGTRRAIEILACGALCLGRSILALEEDTGLYSTAHAKMELLLSLPREFWPKAWSGEESERANTD